MRRNTLIRSCLKGKWNLILLEVLAPKAVEDDVGPASRAEGLDFTKSSVAFVVFGRKQRSLPFPLKMPSGFGWWMEFRSVESRPLGGGSSAAELAIGTILSGIGNVESW